MITESANPLLQPIKRRRSRKLAKVSFGELVAKYLEVHGDRIAVATRGVYTLVWRQFGEWLKGMAQLGFYDIQQIKPQTIRNWLMHRLGTAKVENGTSNKELQILKTLFNFGITCGYWDEVTAPHRIVKAIAGVKPPSRDAFTPEEYAKVRDAARLSSWPWLYPATVIGYHTGLRLRDVGMLKWESVDLDNEVIRLIPHKTKRIGTTVVIPIEPTELFPLLKFMHGIMVEECSKLDAAGAKWHGTYVMPKMAAISGDTEDTNLSTYFTKVVARAGVRPLTFHCLRHTFASRLINAGVDVAVVASMTGHINLQELKGYLHVKEDTKRKAINAGMANG